MSGCSFKLFSAQDYRTYVLSIPENLGGNRGENRDENHTGDAATVRNAADERVIIVTDTTSPSYLAGQKLLFRENARELLAYQFSAWAEPPPRQLTRAIERALAAGGHFKAVIRPSTGVRADLQLNTSLTDFYHDAREKPGFGVMSLQAELVDLDRGVILAKKVFKQQIPAPQYDAQGAVDALDTAAGKIVDEITAWVLSVN